FSVWAHNADYIPPSGGPSTGGGTGRGATGGGTGTGATGGHGPGMGGPNTGRGINGHSVTDQWGHVHEYIHPSDWHLYFPNQPYPSQWTNIPVPNFPFP